MKFVMFASVFLLASTVGAFYVIPPSSITTCAPLTLDYETVTGQPPFSLTFHTGSADGPILVTFTNITGTSFTWDMVTIPAGTNVVIVLSDSGVLSNDTPVITVSPGSSNDCLSNPTSISSLPSGVTSTSPPISTSSGSSIPSSLSATTTTTSPVLTTTTTSSVSSPTPSGSDISKSSTLTSLTDTPRPSTSPTGSLGSGGAIANGVGLFGIGAMTAIMGVILA